MGNSSSLPEIPGGGTEGYHVLRVQVILEFFGFFFFGFFIRLTPFFITGPEFDLE